MNYLLCNINCLSYDYDCDICGTTAKETSLTTVLWTQHVTHSSHIDFPTSSMDTLNSTTILTVTHESSSKFISLAIMALVIAVLVFLFGFALSTGFCFSKMRTQLSRLARQRRNQWPNPNAMYNPALNVYQNSQNMILHEMLDETCELWVSEYWLASIIIFRFW